MQGKFMPDISNSSLLVFDKCQVPNVLVSGVLIGHFTNLQQINQKVSSPKGAKHRIHNPFKLALRNNSAQATQTTG